MKNEVSIEDLQEINVEGVEHFWQMANVRVGKKKLVLETKRWGDGNYESISFAKRSFNTFGELLEIEAVKREVKTVEESVICNLGHQHSVKKKKLEEFHFAQVSMSWEMVESLIEWLQLGSWKQVKK